MDALYKILVPTDFTSVADTALKHAEKIATIMNGQIMLLHVVETESNVSGALEKLIPMVEELRGRGFTAESKVAVGNIFDDIGGVAETVGARLIIMGTHGRKGLQFLTGSNAMKVITNSTIPFLVVQDKQVPVDYKDIVFPIDLKVETKMKIKVTASMAKTFGSKVHIFGETDDDPFTSKQIENNIGFAKKLFDKYGIEYTVKMSPGDSDFVKECVHYSVSVDADFIVVLNLNYRSIAHFLKNDEEAMITNEAQIPVLMVNPTSDFISKSPLFGQYQAF